MGNVATRLLSLILLLQSRPSWKASELAEKLDVSERTIHRYMGMLDEMGIPIYSERGPYGGFSLLRGHRLPPLVFTPEEATVLYMGAYLVQEVWGQTYDEAVTAATAKLDNVLSDELREEVARARRSLVVGGLVRRGGRLWEAALHALRRSVGRKHCVQLVYRAQGRQEDTERVVEPYALTFQWGQWYLVGYCRLRGEVRTFRVDRVRQVTELPEQFEVPASFAVREYLDRTLWPPPDHIVTVWVDASVVPMLREEHPNWMQFSEADDGGSIARFGVNGLDWAQSFVLGLGPLARVIGPTELVDRVCEAVRGLAELYGCPEGARSRT